MKKVIHLICLVLLIYSCNNSPYLSYSDPVHAQTNNSKRVVDMYLVGSHDACAFVAGGSLIITQDLNLRGQLDAGVRVFDIRLRPVGDGSGKMIAYHGIASQRQELSQDILPIFIDFLQQNPDEFVVLSFKDEGAPISGDQESYAQALTKALSSSKVQPYLYSDLTEETTLDEIKSKIVPLHRSSIGSMAYGAAFGPWQDDATFDTELRVESGHSMPVFVQDNYKISSINARDKKADILNAFRHSDTQSDSTLNIFYISGTGAFCYPDRAARILNPQVLSLFRQTEVPPPGIYFFDFCGRSPMPQLIALLNQQNR